MSKDLSSHQQKIVRGYYEHQETIQAERLSDLLAEIWLCEDRKQATRLWGRAQAALMKAGCNPTLAAKVAGDGDVEELARLVKEIDAGRGAGNSTQPDKPTTHAARAAASVADGRTIAQMKRDRAAAAGTDSLDAENLKRAMRMFKRKLKTMRRDDESQVRGRYVTRGESSNIVAINPPNDFPPAVWQELARQGKLQRAGEGMYQLP